MKVARPRYRPRVMKVEVIRSTRRRKTVQARQVDGILRVSIPANMTARLALRRTLLRCI